MTSSASSSSSSSSSTSASASLPAASSTASSASSNATPAAPDRVRVAALQMVSAPDVAANLETAARLIADAADAGVDVALLPEYFCILGNRDTDKVGVREADSADAPGPIRRFLADAARRHRIVLIGGTLPLAVKDPKRVLNTTLVFDAEGKEIGRYDKIHLFGLDRDGDRFDESATIQAGRTPVVCDVARGAGRPLRVGLSICYDLRFPELYRRMAPVDLIVVPSAFTYQTGRAHWEILLRARARGEDFDVGLRINPMHAEGEVPRYDPCAPHSRLGFPIDQLRPEHIDLVDGIHFHTLCEQDFEPLARTWDKVFDHLEPYFDRLKWLNFGGGHHITRADYQRDELVEFLRDVQDDTGCEVYLEPGEAVALDAGILVGTILDTHWNGMPLAITDISATCHMPDVIEAPYRPAMLGEEPLEGIQIDEGQGGAVRLGGPSCLAGDVIGDYRLPVPGEPGQRIAFLDQAHYSMVKTTTFNGVPLPSIWLWDSESDSLEQIRKFGYEDFRDRLS